MIFRLLLSVLLCSPQISGPMIVGPGVKGYAGGGSPVTLVQQTVGAAPTTATNLTLAFGSNNTAGNKIVAVVQWAMNTGHSAVTISSCTDTRSNTYTVKASSHAQATGTTHYAFLDIEVCTADSITAGANTVSINFSAAADGCTVTLYEVTAGQDDVFGPATGNSATPTSASVSVASNSFQVAAGLLDDGFGFGSGWFNAGTGWTLGYEKGGGNQNGYTEYQTGTGSVQGTCTSNFSGTTGGWAAIIYSIKP